MAWEESDSLLVSDVEALLRIVGQERLAAEQAARVLDGLCKLLPARGVEVGEAPGLPSRAAARRPAASPAGAAPTAARAALDDGGRRLCCTVGGGRRDRFQFRRGPRDEPFGVRELTIVGAMACANWLRSDGFGALTAGEPGPRDGPDGFAGFDGFTASKLTAGNPGAGPSSTIANLPRRQHEVLDRLRQGDSNKQVARALVMGVDTVKSHVKHLYRRFDASSRGELIARAFLGIGVKPQTRRVR